MPRPQAERSDDGTAAALLCSARLRLSRPRRRAAGGAGRARREPPVDAGAVEPVAARREHADALAAFQLGQADGALRLRPHTCTTGSTGRLRARAGAGSGSGAGGELGLLRIMRLRLRQLLLPQLPRGATAREAAEEEARGGVEGEGEQGHAGQDDEDGGHVGEEGAGAGVGAPRSRGRRRRRPRGRRRGGDHCRRRRRRRRRRCRGVHGGRGGVVGPARHGCGWCGGRPQAV